MRVCEHAFLRKMFGPNSGEATRERRNLYEYTAELHDLYSSVDMSRMIRSRRKRKSVYVARIAEKWVALKCWFGNLKRNNHLE